MLDERGERILTPLTIVLLVQDPKDLQSLGEESTQRVPADGKYTFKCVRPGNYRLMPMRSTSGRVRFGLPARGLGAMADLAFAQTAPVPPSNDQPAGAAGEVRNTIDGSPVERAHVSLQRFNNGGMDRYGALTNAEGKFAIANIPAGNYNIMMDRVGYIDLNGPAARVLKLNAGEKKDTIKLKLTPTGTITGRVLDGDGKPVEWIPVMAESGNRTERSGLTDDRGVYRIGGLGQGKYRVKASPTELPLPPEIRTDTTVEVHYSATYHPNALDAKSATRVQVGAGTGVPGIDIHLVRTPIVHVSGKVAGMPPGAQNAFVSLRPVGFPGGGGSSGGQVRPDGTFEIWRPAPGKCTIQAN